MTILDQVAHIPNGVSIVTGWLGEGAIPVSKEISQERASICLKCPHNVQGNFFTETVAAAIKNVVKIKNGLGIRCDGEKALGACEICTCSLKVKVHVDSALIKKHMMPEELEKFPAWCWQKK